jgi:beta-glucanase (GH16 family)
MKFIKIFSVILLAMVIAACGKKSSGGNATPNNPPTGLALASTVSADASGNVTFVATATNAVSYEFDFGNGLFQTSTSGSVTYKYPAAGTYTVQVTAKSSSGQTAIKSIQVTVSLTTIPGGTGATWAEEFNTDGAPNPALWGYDLGGGGWGNNELEYYTNRSDNVIVSGGTLKIKLKKEDYMGSTYTSARILTLNKFSFKYGKIEIRAKMPAGSGTWPAIWTMGDDIATNPWPGCGEIDIVEHLGRDLNKIYGTVHYPGHSGGNSVGGTTVIANATTEFHRYALDWSATAIKFMVDDVVYFTVANDSSLPFNHKFFIILNVAMGGNFGGAVDPAFSNGQMEVDYIRLYQ